jgi:hypothetical protein
MRIRAALSLVVLATTLSCGHDRRDGETVTTSSEVSGPTAPRQLDTPASPALPAMCSVGTGSPHATCERAGGARLWPAVDAAIDDLVKSQPGLFNLERVIGQKGYYVQAHDAFYLALADALQAKGLCAQYDFRVLNVKDSAGESEEYEVLFPNGHLRRDAGSLVATCTPASFPLDPAVVISRVRVAFYSIQCEDGRTPPRNGEGLLPSDCTGFVTATPKKADDSDVYKRINGPEIVWELEQSGNQVVVEDFPNVTFNKFVRGRDLGAFRLCATVQTHKGCLEGEVVP